MVNSQILRHPSAILLAFVALAASPAQAQGTRDASGHVGVSWQGNHGTQLGPGRWVRGTAPYDAIDPEGTWAIAATVGGGLGREINVFSGRLRVEFRMERVHDAVAQYYSPRLMVAHSW